MDASTRCKGDDSAFRRAGSFRGESAVTTWLHRIVVNACLDRRPTRRAARDSRH
jgi:RNA polymerase sigma-70 factor (ECF subfamily)